MLETCLQNRVYLLQVGNEEVVMDNIRAFEQKEIERLTAEGSIPEFGAGDTLRVLVTVVEGDRKRKQAYEGICIARKNRGLNSSFTVRKISYGEGVERVFPLYSPLIDIEVIRRGDVRRAKLYYLRALSGKKARIKERRYDAAESQEAKASAEGAEKKVKTAAG